MAASEKQIIGSRPVLRWIISIGLCLALVTALGAYKVMQIKAAIAFGESFPEHSETVDAMQTQASLWQTKRRAVGHVKAAQMLDLSTELGGRIEAVGFESGALVKKGQVLLQLDQSEEQARYQAALANEELASLALKRIEKLRKNNTASEEQYDQARALQTSAAAELRSLQAIMRKKTVRAPFDARAGLHHLEPGQLIQGGASITTLIGLQNYLWVDFTLPLGPVYLNIGDRVWIEPDLPADVVAMDSVVSESSRTMTYRAQLALDTVTAAQRSRLIHNAMVNVLVPEGDASPAVRIPKTALKRDSFGTYVFSLINAEEAGKEGIDTPAGAYRAKRHKVTLGAELGTEVVVSEGLQAERFIAAKGAYKLREGILVYVNSNTPDTSAKQGEQ